MLISEKTRIIFFMKTGISDNMLDSSAKREFIGFIACGLWFFSAYVNYDETIMSSDHNWVTLFCFLIGGGMIATGLIFRNRISTLSKIASITTPITIVITAVAHFLPADAFIALYMVAGLLCAPVMVRRGYGLLATCPENQRFRRFMFCIALGPTFNVVGALLVPTMDIWFAIIAALLIPGWVGIRRKLPEIPLQMAQPPVRNWKIVIIIAITIVLFHCSTILQSVLHTFLLNKGMDAESPILALAAAILPAVAFVFYAWFADKERERQGLMIAVVLFIVGMFVMLIPNQSYSMEILAIADGLGGTYSEFFVMSFSLYFFVRSRNPLLMATLGLGIDIIGAGHLWSGWLVPDFLSNIDLRTDAYLEPIVYAVSGIFFVLIVFFVMLTQDREKERLLANYFVEKLYGRAGAGVDSYSAVDSGLDNAQDVSMPVPMGLADMTQEEQRIATLLVEGYTRGEIARKLRLSASDVKDSFASIKTKLSGENDSVVERSADTLLAQVSEEYGLTTRESHILRGIYEGKTNAEIASEIFVADTTVKTHINNLMKKLPIAGRSEVREWLLKGGSDNN